MLTKCRSGLLGLGLLLAAAPAHADVTYAISYTTTGISFVCDQYLGANCSVGANSVTLFSNGGSLTFTATPQSGSFVESNASGVSVPFGTINWTVTGPFTTLPTGASQEALFTFTVPFTFTTVDGTFSSFFNGDFYRNPGNTTGRIQLESKIFSIPSPSLPKGFGASFVVSSTSVLPYTGANGSGTVFGTASISPEPSTIVLSASGLGILGLFSLRRKRRSS